MIFVVAQFLYTVIVLLPVVAFHRYYVLHCMWLCYLFTVCVWNGGSYYIEVFSRRYSKVAFADKEPIASPKAAGKKAAGKATPDGKKLV